MPAIYDVVVVGAGNGGLAAACTASSLGLKTLLVEQHNLPGGLATSFVRGRFEFEPSLHTLSDLGTQEAPGALRNFFERLGIYIDWQTVPEAYRMIITDAKNPIDVAIPLGIDAYIEAIEKAVPGSKNSVSVFLQLCKDVINGLTYIDTSKGNPDIKVLMGEHRNLLRTSACSVDEVQEVLRIPQKARDIINAYWCYLGTDTSKLNFTVFGAMLYTILSTGVHIPKMRSHEIACKFDRRIRNNGADIRYNTEVTKIHVENAAVTGVTLSTGEKIETKHVISNATQHMVFSKMITPAAEIPPKQLKMANSRVFSYSGAVVYLGLDKSKEELGLNEYEYFIYPTTDNKQLYKSMETIEESVAQATVCLNSAIPDCSPKGTTILSILMFYKGTSWDGVTPESYFELKNKIAEQAIEYFERALGIKISDSIEEIEVATPQTFARYTGNYKGEILGYVPESWDSILPRMMMMEEDNSIKGLRFCGKSGFRLGGYASSLLSGESIAHLTFNDVQEKL